MPTEKDTPPCANHMPACSGAQLVSFRLIADQVGPLIADDSRNVPGNDLFAGTPGIPSKLARQRRPRSSPAISETSFTTFLLAAGFQDPLKFRDCQTEDRCGGQSMSSISGQFHCPTDGTSAPAFFSSLRLASRQTLRAVVTLSVHLNWRHMAAAIACVRMAPRRNASTRGCVR